MKPLCRGRDIISPKMYCKGGIKVVQNQEFFIRKPKTPPCVICSSLWFLKYCWTIKLSKVDQFLMSSLSKGLLILHVTLL